MDKYSKEVKKSLFLRLGDRIFAVIYESAYSVLTFDGEAETGYDDEYWEKFKSRASYLSGQKNDFCFISDSEEWYLPDWIVNSRTDITRWNTDTICEAVKELGLRYNLFILDRYGKKIRINTVIRPEKTFDLCINNPVSGSEPVTEPQDNTDSQYGSELEAYFMERRKEDKERNRR